MLLAGFVVAEEFALENVFEKFARDGARTGRGRFGAASGEFERVVGGAGVAVGEGRDAKEDLVSSFYIFAFMCGRKTGDSEAAFFVGDGAAEQLNDLRRGKRIEDIDLGSREKRRDNLERGVFGGGADEGDVPGFDVGEEGVLLGFVE